MQLGKEVIKYENDVLIAQALKIAILMYKCIHLENYERSAEIHPVSQALRVGVSTGFVQGRGDSPVIHRIYTGYFLRQVVRIALHLLKPSVYCHHHLS